jgi:hypothetical protein
MSNKVFIAKVWSLFEHILYFVKEEQQQQQQQQQTSAEVAIMNTGQRNHQPNLHCCLCSSCSQRKGTVYKCARCDVGLYVVPCFTQ